MSYDDTVRNEDWIKTLRWDLPGVDTIEELRLLFPDLSDADLRKLPAIEAAPPAIRRSLGLPT